MTEPNSPPLEWTEPDQAAEVPSSVKSAAHPPSASPSASRADQQTAEAPSPGTTDTATTETSTAPSSSSVSPSTSWEPLTPLERRILGVLIEKQKTLAYTYPLSLHALVIGCNQKDNREPVMNVTEEEAEETLEVLISKGLVEPVYGGRVTHYRHKLYEKWTSDGKELAVLAELLLRGAQNRGSLRARASRMDKIADVAELDQLLQRLAQRRLVVFLTPPQRRGAVVTHGFHTPQELTQLLQTVAAEEGEPEGRSPARTDTSSASAELAGSVGKTRLTLQEQLETLTKTVGELQRRIERLEAFLNLSGSGTGPDTASHPGPSA